MAGLHKCLNIKSAQSIAINMAPKILLNFIAWASTKSQVSNDQSGPKRLKSRFLIVDCIKMVQWNS